MTLPRGCSEGEFLPPACPSTREALWRGRLITALLVALILLGFLGIAYEAGRLSGYREGRDARLLGHERLQACMTTLELAADSFAACHGLAQYLKNTPAKKPRRIVAAHPSTVPCTNCGGP